MNPKSGSSAHYEARHEDYTIAWICALPLELAASRAMLDDEHRPLPIDTADDNAYVLGHIDPGASRTSTCSSAPPRARRLSSASISRPRQKQINTYMYMKLPGGRPATVDLTALIASAAFETVVEARGPGTPYPRVEPCDTRVYSSHSSHLRVGTKNRCCHL
jgi:hypothetical protein